MNGTEISHQLRFLEMYAGCRDQRYGPLVMMPRCVRLENRRPKATVDHM